MTRPHTPWLAGPTAGVFFVRVGPVAIRGVSADVSRMLVLGGVTTVWDFPPRRPAHWMMMAVVAWAAAWAAVYGVTVA